MLEEETKEIALRLAVQTSNIKEIEEVLESTPELVNVCDEDGLTLLHEAVEIGNIEIMKLLLSKMSPEIIIKPAKDNSNYTALHLAVQDSNFTTVKNLIDTLEKNQIQLLQLVNAIDENDQTALHWAAGKGDTSITELLLNKMSPEIIIKPAKDNNNYTALHLAVQSGNKDVVEKLLNFFNAGPSKLSEFINATDKNGQTALHWAASKGNVAITELLLAKKPDPEIIIKPVEGNNNYTVLHLAVQSSNKDVVEKLLSIFSADSSKLSQFINAVDMYGQTALHWAAGKGNVAITELLLEKRPDPEIIIKPVEGNNNYTALHLAVQSGNKDIVIKLLSIFNADPSKLSQFINAVDKNGQTALHWSAGKGDTNITELLLERMSIEDITKEAKSNNDYTALHLAVYGGNNQVVEALLTSLKSPDQRLEFIMKTDTDGYTAIHLAAVKNLKNFKLSLPQIKNGNFVQYDKNLNDYKPAWDYKLLRFVAGTGNDEIIKTLLSFLPDDQILQLINLTDSNGQNILHFAVLGGEKIVRLFLDKINPEIITDAKYGNILRFAAENGAAEVFELLLKSKSASLETEQLHNILCGAARTQNIEAIDVLLKNDYDIINHVDSNGGNILHHMMFGHHKGKGVTELLSFLESRSEFSKLLNAQDQNGQTALHFATAHATTVGDVKVVEWLIKKMSPEAINAKNDNGDTALYIAVKKFNAPSIVKSLIEAITPDNDTHKVTSYLDLMYSIVNTPPQERYDDNGTLKQEFSQMLTQVFSLIMGPGVHTDDLNGIIRMVHSKVSDLETHKIKKLIDNKLHELQPKPEAVSNQEPSGCLDHLSEASHKHELDVEETQDTGRNSNLFEKVEWGNED